MLEKEQERLVMTVVGKISSQDNMAYCYFFCKFRTTTVDRKFAREKVQGER